MNDWVILPFLMLAVLPARAQSSAANVVGARPGYVFDVEGEKNQHNVELVLIDPPPPTPTINQRLFDEKLTKDLRQQYEYRFGHTALEQTINAPQSREEAYYYKGDTTVTAQAYQRYQRSFGEYVGRKVIETQFDKFFKSEPSLKPIYDAKDKFSNLSVKTGGYKLKWHYNFSGNTMEGEVENPYHIETKISVQFRQFSTETLEETVSLAYPINPLWTVSSFYKFYDGLVQIVGTRKITTTVSANLTGSSTTTGDGPSVRQTMGLVGISWTQ